MGSAFRVEAAALGPVLVPAFAPAFAGKAGSMHKRASLYYDTECGLCLTAARWVSRLDVFERIKLRGSLDDLARVAGITEAALDRSIQLVCPSGKTFAGFHAFRQILLRLPPLWPVAPLGWIPGAAYIGVRLYRWVADLRSSVFKSDHPR